MDNEPILIAEKDGGFCVKIRGRVNFSCAVPLRQLASRLTPGVKELRFDASECTFMDSTFMGVMSMLAMQARKAGAEPVICGANEHVFGLLRGLGVSKVFRFTDGDGAEQIDSWRTLPGGRSRLETAETVVEAHETLADADQANRERFKDVIRYAKEDVEQLKKESES